MPVSCIRRIWRMKTTPVISHAVTWAHISRFSSKTDRGRPQVFVRQVSRNLFRGVFFPHRLVTKLLKEKNDRSKRAKLGKCNMNSVTYSFYFSCLLHTVIAMVIEQRRTDSVLCKTTFRQHFCLYIIHLKTSLAMFSSFPHLTFC